MVNPFEVLRARLGGDPVADARLALVIEGGGMRGVISSAMAGVLESFGAHQHIDLFVGTSAGATNAVAAAGGKVDAMSRAYVEEFSDRKYADSRRLLRGRPAVDARLITSTSESMLSLYDGLRADATVGVVATDVETGEAEVFSDFGSRDDLVSALTASGSLPIVGGPVVAYAGRRWTDGGVVDSVPVAAAATLGATHAIVLATRPAGSAPAYGSMDRMVETYLRRYCGNLADAYRRRPERYLAQRQAMEAGSFAGVRTSVLAPSATDTVPGRTNRDRRLLASARSDARATAEALLRTAGFAPFIDETAVA
ncbi:putative patatin/cPLA2 family phospholipase [Nocardioides albertanoniae]|uniref:Putative patatin/cPLA2 family phospholipase n=1 Tax=Nocardioides albertanoniae TaxID=1175486 RepID=A0A543A658_9ACTN|nr:patatin-like phospholipase family protein [Nocardioides albertanoniae]TQL68029.1 putative patatin/cPLA2 family phospholipase [Nocardioides albertanoniae]